MSAKIVNKLVSTIDCKQEAVRNIRYNVDGHYCMTCGSDKTLKLWNPQTGTLIKTYRGHGYEVMDAQGSCDNSQLCSGGMDKCVILFDVASGNVLRKYRGHVACVNCVAFNEESTLIMSGSLDGSIRIWDTKSKSMEPIQMAEPIEVDDEDVRQFYENRCGCAEDCLAKFPKHVILNQRIAVEELTREEKDLILIGQIRALRSAQTIHVLTKDNVMDEAKDSVTCLLVTDHEIVTGSADGRVRRYDLRMGALNVDFIGKAVTSLNMTRDGQCLLVGTLDSSVKLMDKDSGEMLNEYTGHKNDSYKVGSCVSSSDTHVLSGSEDGMVYIWDLLEGKNVSTLKHKERTVHGLTYHPTEATLLTAAGQSMYMWESNQ